MPRSILYPTGRAPASTAPETPHADAFRTEPPFVDRTPQVRPNPWAPKLPSTAPEAVHAEALQAQPWQRVPLEPSAALLASLMVAGPPFVAPAVQTTDPARWTGEVRQAPRALPPPQMPQAPGPPSTAPEAITADRVQAFVVQPARLPAVWPRMIQSGPTALPSLVAEAVTADRIQANPWQPSRALAARPAPPPSFVLPPAEVASWQPSPPVLPRGLARPQQSLSLPPAGELPLVPAPAAWQPVQAPPVLLPPRPQPRGAPLVWVAPVVAPVLPVQGEGLQPARLLLRPQPAPAPFVWVAPVAAPVLPVQPTPWQPGLRPAPRWIPFGGGDVLLPVVTPPGEPGPLIFGSVAVSEVGSLTYLSADSVSAGPLSMTDVGGVTLVDVSEVDI